LGEVGRVLVLCLHCEKIEIGGQFPGKMKMLDDFKYPDKNEVVFCLLVYGLKQPSFIARKQKRQFGVAWQSMAWGMA
jgi:hypothetical protein